MSCQVISTGSSHSRFINGNNSTVGVSDESSIDTTIGNNSMGSKVVSTSSGHGRFIYRDNGTVGVSDEWEDSGKRSTVVVAMIIDSSHWASNCMSNRGHRGDSKSNWSHSKVGEVVRSGLW